MRDSKLGRYVVASSLVLVLGVPAVAVGFGEGRTVKAGERNPSSRSLTAETEIISSNGTYGTRQSNKRDGDGGGAIYGCRSDAGNEPCVRANNLKGGRAFELSTVGKEAGRIEVGDASGAPFTTNATGVATGLNADKVDGQDATSFAASNRFLTARVGGGGVLQEGSAGARASQLGGPPYVVTFNRDVSKCSTTATAVGAAQPLGVEPVANQPTQVRVRTGGAATAFNLQVICAS